MGDRGNIELRYPDGRSVWFYTHWRGSSLDDILASALDRGRGRWTDPAYLARIIFCELIGDDVSSETGFGIDVQRGDYNHDDLVVNLSLKKVKSPIYSGTDFMDFETYIGLVSIGNTLKESND